MHWDCLNFVTEQVGDQLFPSVLEIGGMNVNGSVRQYVRHETWHTVDIVDGPDVDEVADAGEWRPQVSYDLVLCLEVFEHAWNWPSMVQTMFLACGMNGLVVATCATDPREPHDAYGAAGPPPLGQYYRNVNPGECVGFFGKYFNSVKMTVLDRGDLQIVAHSPRLPV
jgi:hypothetical protein